MLLGRKAMTNLDIILKNRGITLLTKVHIVKAIVFPVVMYGCENWTIKKAVCVLCSVVSDSLWPHGLQPTRLLCPWNVPGKNTGVGCHFLLQGIFEIQGSYLRFLYWQADSLPLSHVGSIQKAKCQKTNAFGLWFPQTLD